MHSYHHLKTSPLHNYPFHLVDWVHFSLRAGSVCARLCVRASILQGSLLERLDDTPRNFPHRPRPHPPLPSPQPGANWGPFTRGGDQPRSMRRARAPALRYLGLSPTRLSSSSPSASASPPPPGAAELASCPFRRSASAPQGSAGKVTVCTNRAFKFIKFIGFFTNE